MNIKYVNKEYQKNFNKSNINRIKVDKKYILKIRIKNFFRRIFKI